MSQYATLILAISLFAPKVFAQKDSFNSEANQVCMAYNFPRDQEECLARLRGRYFDPAGVAVCKQFTFIRDQENCLLQISDLSFSPEVITVCNRHTFPSDKAKCLARLGDPHTNPVTDREEIIGNLNQALNELRSRNFGRAEFYIQESIRMIQESL